MTPPDYRYDAARSMLEKLRQFASQLDEAERAALHALLVPGVASAFEEEEILGHVSTTWTPGVIPDWLVSAMVDQGIRIEGMH